tara:strand:- start:65 stop:1141 length:1077 start_codon:yes stop_codon:yes gene_type:complete
MPAGQFANALEVCDTKAWAVAGSPHLANVIDALFPHPVRFRQVWGQEWNHTSVFAWSGVAPPGFVAVGMMLTSTNEPPDVSSYRCIPKQWTQQSQIVPKLVWSNQGGGGRAASAWITNSLGVAHVVLGHDAPNQDELLDLIAPEKMLLEDILAPVERKPAGATKANAQGFATKGFGSGSVSDTSASGGYGATSGDCAPPLRGRAAMFESVAEERRGELAAKEKRERERRDREEKGLAQLQQSSGADIFGGFFSDTAGNEQQPSLVTVAPAGPTVVPPAARAADVNPFGGAGAGNRPAVPPSASNVIPGMDLLTGSPVAPVDPLGALDPLGAGSSVRVKPKTPVSIFGAAAAKRNKKAE